MREDYDLEKFANHLKKIEKSSPLIWQTCRGYHLIGSSHVLLTLAEQDVTNDLYTVLCSFGLSQPELKIQNGVYQELSPESKLRRYVDKPTWEAPRVVATNLVREPRGSGKSYDRPRYLAYSQVQGPSVFVLIKDVYLSIISEDADIFFRDVDGPGDDLRHSFYFTNQVVIAPMIAHKREHPGTKDLDYQILQYEMGISDE